ncbi:MAG: hypothetical protein R2861_10995 [Desulfobacterales bacterium]
MAAMALSRQIPGCRSRAVGLIHNALDIHRADHDPAAVNRVMQAADNGVNGFVKQGPGAIDDPFDGLVAAPDNQRDAFAGNINGERVFRVRPIRKRYLGITPMLAMPGLKLSVLR